jgi:hypothetical protein
MVFKTLFRRFFKEEDEGPSVSDIDAETEAAVNAIKTTATVDVEAEKVLQSGWGKPGEMVYIMNLSPIYTILGGREGRAGISLRESCGEVFKKYVKLGKGQSSFVGDNFFMKFYTLGDSEGYHRAAVITNEIGTSILGDRFETVDVPDLVIAAETQDVTNEDGSINLEKSAAAQESGGADVDKTPKDRLKAVQVAYYPTWTPAYEMVETYACYARRQTSNELVYGDAVYPESASDPLSILIDGKKAKLAVRDMETLAHFNWKVNLFLPLRFATLRSRQAAGIAKIIGEISPAWRNKHLIIEIVNIPEKATGEHLKPLVEWAKTHGHGAAIRASFATPKLDRISASGAICACFDFDECKDQDLNLKEYVSQVHALGAQATLWNVNENSALGNVIDAGFNLLNGTAVVSPTGAVDNRREVRTSTVTVGL